MSRHAVISAPDDQEPEAAHGAEGTERAALTLVELPAPPDTPALDAAEEAVSLVTLDYQSLGFAEYERGSLLRLFRSEFSNYVRHLTSERGGKLSFEEACREASARYDAEGAAELMQRLLSRPAEGVTFDELRELWRCSPEEAERYFAIVKNEAQREFQTGHLAAKVFEPVDWLRSVWTRAQFLAVRDSFIMEYEPEGGIEYALVDTLAICFFMQQYWAGVAVKRTKTDPRRETIEYREWNGYRGETAKRRRFEPGEWDVPLVTEDRAVRASGEMLEQFSRLFQRTLRQLNGHRLAKLKAQKLQAEIRHLKGKIARDVGEGV